MESSFFLPESRPFLWNFRLAPWKTKDVPPAFAQLQDLDIDTFEVHYFWPITTTSVIVPTFEQALYYTENYRHKFHDDHYVLSSDLEKNLKFRKGELLLKQEMFKRGDIHAFAKKVHYLVHHTDGIEESDLLKLATARFPQVTPLEVVHVIKESMRLKLKAFPTTKIEFSRLVVEDNHYVSLCIEGKNLETVVYLNEQLDFKTPPQSYMSFIKEMATR
ncbi:MAG: hypothetical protein ACK5TR_05125 [Alphaproteobacteria bacterium]